MKRKYYCHRNSVSGFTLVELLTVIAMVALLSCLVMPALARARLRSPAEQCLSNYRQLMIGWLMYKEDNNDVLMPNAPAGGNPNQMWVAGSEDWTANPVNTNTLVLLGGLMSPYVGKDVRVFKCPADVVPSLSGQRVRSCSMNAQMGIIFNVIINYDAPALLYAKGSDLTCPAPANAFILCDEHPDSIDDGYMQVETHNGNFPEVPASYHGNACGFGFADGHAEEHRWTTTVLAIPITVGSKLNYVSGGTLNADWIWFSQHSACDHH